MGFKTRRNRRNKQKLKTRRKGIKRGGIPPNNYNNNNTSTNRKAINYSKFSRVGKGAFGSVYRPPLPCIEGFNDNKWIMYDNNQYLSKLAEEGSAANEIYISDIIREKFPNYENYFCLVDYICPVDEKYLRINNVNLNNKNKNNNNSPRRHSFNYRPENELEYRDTLAISKYCGLSLDKILQGETDIVLNRNNLWFFLDRLKFLIKGILKLNNLGIFHEDLHIGNIVYKQATEENNTSPGVNNLLLIDFGQAKYLEDYLENVINEEAREANVLRFKINELENIFQKLLRRIITYIVDNYIFAPHLDDRKYKRIHGNNNTSNLESKEFFESFHRRLSTVKTRMVTKLNTILSTKMNTIEKKQIVLDRLYELLNDVLDTIPDYNI